MNHQEIEQMNNMLVEKLFSFVKTYKTCKCFLHNQFTSPQEKTS